MHEYVEGLRNIWFREVIPFNDSLVGLCPAHNVIRFDRKQLLEDIGCPESFQCPDFHFSKALATKLCLTPQRLLGNQRVRTYRAGVHLIVHHVGQFQHINDTYRSLLVEALASFPVMQVRLP